MTDLEYQNLKRVIRKLTGIDLDAYKEEQMRRRLDSFVQHRAFGNHLAFVQSLEKDEKLQRDLTDMLTINVTEFFRDTVVFDHLRDAILPGLLKERRTLRVWSAGCSRGCEPFTLAMLLDELDGRTNHHLLATDVDERAMAVGRAGGPFPPSDIKGIPQAYRSRYFVEKDGRLHVTDAVRQRVQFKPQNLLSDAFESGFDLIVCRNVMIYFTLEARRAITEKFFDSLSPGGLLLLGSTEALMPGDAAGFQSAGASLYQKTAQPTASALLPDLLARRSA